MAVKLKKIFRRIFIALFTLFFLLMLVVGILINFVFTPDKLTPQLVSVANDYIDGRVELREVELTFFSTFPELTVDLNDGLLTTSQGDTLLSFEFLSAHLNLKTIFDSRQILVEELIIHDPYIYATLDKNTESNWNIYQGTSSPDTTAVSKETTSDELFIVKDLRIIGGSVHFEDFSTLFTAEIPNMNFTGRIAYENEKVDMDVNLIVDDVSLMLDNESIVNPVSLTLHSRNAVEIENSKIYLDTLLIKLRDEELQIESQGTLQQDTTGTLLIDLKNRFYTSNIIEAMNLIPLRYMDLAGFKGKGEIDLVADIQGPYNEKDFPLMMLDLKISDATATYKDLPKKIDLFETAVSANVDFLNKRNSAVDLSYLNITSDGITLKLKGKFTEILTNPHVVLNGEGFVSFGDLLETLPLENLDAVGKANFQLNSDLFLQDIVNYDYGKIDVSGKVEFEDVNLKYLDDSLTFFTNSSKIAFGQEQNATKLGQENARLLSSRLSSNDLKLSVKDLVDLETKRLKLSVKTVPLEDSTLIFPVVANFSFKKATANVGDTLSLLARQVEGSGRLQSSKKDAKIPVLSSRLYGKSFRVDQGVEYAALKGLNYKLRFEKKEKKWPMRGELSFDRFTFFTKSFPRKVFIDSTSLGITTNRLTLNNTTVNVGKSSMNLSGKIDNLQETIFNNSTLTGELDVKSDFINVNQLSKILDQGANATSGSFASEDTAYDESDTLGLETFVVPKNVDFKLGLNVKRIRYGDLVFRKVRGNLFIEDQTVRLRNIKMKSKAADMRANAKYVARNKRRARANFDVTLTDVDIANMIEVMPFMDTLLPMVRDFEGNLDLGMKGFARIGKNMAINESSLEAVARLEGQNLILLDGETFQYMAKTLKFKNRERNLLDSVAVEMAVQGGSIEIFPSLVSMDRYQVAIGGTQNLDLTYDYHISVLKSPAPFKAGIDITGKGVDYDFKLTKAKYKFLFSDKKKDQEKVDQEMVRRRNEILERIKFD